MTLNKTDVPTPVEAAGYKPIWAENFSDGSFDCMRISPAFGMLDDYDSYLLPGTLHLGQKNCTKGTEQQIKYYRDIEGGEPFAQTYEWTIGLTRAADNPEFGGTMHRLFFRVRSHSDGAFFLLEAPNETARLRHRHPVDKPLTKVRETPPRLIEDMPDLRVGPGDWIHCVLTYRRDPDSLHVEAAFAANGVMVAWEGPSTDPPELPFLENWSMEWASGIMPRDGWYIRNVRGYAEYIEPDRLKKIIDAGLDAHLADQPDMKDLEAMYEQRNIAIQSDQRVRNVTEPPADGIPDEATTWTLEDFVVRAPDNNGNDDPLDDPILILRRPDPTERNLYVMINAMRVLKVEYDTRGEAEAAGAFQSSFRIGMGMTGWVDNLKWHTIAEMDGLTEGGVFTFYPDMNARGFLIDRVSVMKDGEPADFWFWNLKNLKITGIPIEDQWAAGATFLPDRTRILPKKFTED